MRPTLKAGRPPHRSNLCRVPRHSRGLTSMSYRTLLARLADTFQTSPPTSVIEVAQRLTDAFWPAYLGFSLKQRFDQLCAKRDYNPAAAANPNARSAEEQKEYAGLSALLVVGFCIAGYVLPDRAPELAHVTFDPAAGKPTSQPGGQEGSLWWGVPNIISRLIHGADHNLRTAILSSGHWSGTPADLDAVIQQQTLMHGPLPIRDAVDYVHACIYTTIKAMKFSSMPQVCGGAYRNRGDYI